MNVPANPVLSYAPVVLPVPGRPVDLRVRVSAPATGTGLPVVLLSHGHGASRNLSSLNGYAPLADRWAAAGFAVLQPTHLSSSTLSGVDAVAGSPDGPLFWRARAEDMSALLDRLGDIEATVPQLAGRLDHGKVAVAGHSLGGHTAEVLLGAQVTEPGTGEPGTGEPGTGEPGTGEPGTGERVDLRDPRITAGVLLAPPGRGGAEVLTGPMAGLVPFFTHTDLSTMTTPALIVAGDKDDSRHFTDVGPDWHTDAYHLAPSPKTLLTLHGAEHGLGGISGYDAAETTDEHPPRVDALARLTAAYLRSTFDPGDPAWRTACAALAGGGPDAVGTVVSR